MRDEEAQTMTTTNINSNSNGSSSSVSSSVKKDVGFFENGVFGRGKYKLWVLGAIVLLAVWSMFTGTVTLKWSSVNLKHSPDEFDTSIRADLDILDVDERGKMVRQMWNSYKHSKMMSVPSFWREAFAAAYQDLTNEAPGVQNAALIEIAKLSFQSTDVQDSAQDQSDRTAEEMGSIKQR